MEEENLNNNPDFRYKNLMSKQIGFGLNVSGWIAFPVIFGFFLGRFIVDKFKSPEYIFYICVAISVAISFYGLIKSTTGYVKKLEEDNAKDKKHLDSQEIKNVSKMVYEETKED